MREAFAFRLSPETTWDENTKTRLILNFDPGYGAADFAWDTCQNEAKTHDQNIVKSTASGLPDCVGLSRVETNLTLFDVSPALSVTQFFLRSARSTSQGIRHRLRGKRSRNIRGSTPKSLVGPKRLLLSATVRSLSDRQTHRFAQPKQDGVRERVVAAILRSPCARRASPAANDPIKTKHKGDLSMKSFCMRVARSHRQA
jgi:hypothetical protein